MAIAPIGSSTAAAPQQAAEELTTVTTHCDKQHQHDKSCPHTVTTRPAPQAGAPGRLLDQYI